MRKSFKLGAIVALISLGAFFGSGEKAEAATATCLTRHAGFCQAVGLTVGVTTTVNFDAMKTALEKFYKDNSDALAWSYMKYKGGHWYWVCVNMDVIRFDNATPPCNPNSWGTYGDCNVTCGGGTQYRYNDCGTKSPLRSCNMQPCCGVADRESYERTSGVTVAGRCDVGDTVSNWVDHSGLAADGGIAWTWNCNDGTVDSEQCLAYKKGVCAYDAEENPKKAPYDNIEDACRFGALNSVKLVGGVLKWKCGTGEHTDRHVGDFFSEDIRLGSPVPVDWYGPKSGGRDCQCTPVYEYDCVGTEIYRGSCVNNSGGTKERETQAVKRDIACFPSESLPITKKAYNIATGKHCVNKTVDCAAWGTQDADGGIYHETTY
jgi:hypothetical protein